MKRPSLLRPQARIEIVKQSRDRWMNDAGDFSRALDTASFTLLHGDRQQQIEVANTARDLLAAKGYPVRPAQSMRFDVTARTANGFHSWTAIGRSSIDVLLATLTHFDGHAVTVRVRREASA